MRIHFPSCISSCFSSRALIVSTLVVLAMAGSMAAQTMPLSHEDAHRRAEALLKQMTVEEKAGQMNQASGIVIARAGKRKAGRRHRQGPGGFGAVAIRCERAEPPAASGGGEVPAAYSADHRLRCDPRLPHNFSGTAGHGIVMGSGSGGSSPTSGCPGCPRCRHPVDLHSHGRYRARCALGPDRGRRGRRSLPGCGHGGCAGTRISGRVHWSGQRSGLREAFCRVRRGRRRPRLRLPPTFPKSCFATSTWFLFMRRKRPALAAS